MTDKPAMPANLRQVAARTKERLGEKYAPPRIAITGEFERWDYACPYRAEDCGDWEALLLGAFGTRSQSVAYAFLDSLAKLCGYGWNAADQQWRPEPDELNLALSIVASTNPQNESQAAIAAQMVALHFTAMKLGGVMGQMTAPDERTAATLARVAKAYANLSRTLADLQGHKRNRQDIHVHYHKHDEQHVHLGGGAYSGGQSHETTPTGQFAECAALPSPDKAWDALPVPLDAERAVQATWWQKLRRAFG